MQAPKPGFEATDIKERYSRQKKKKKKSRIISSKKQKGRCVWIEVIMFFWDSVSLRGSSVRQKPDLNIFISL